MLTRHLDYDAFTGMETLFHYDELTDTTIIESKQDVEPQLEATKAMHIARAEKGGKLGDYEHYAHIPNGLITKWKVEKGVDVFNKDHQKKVFQLLNDPEYLYLKVATFYHRPK